MEPVLRPWFVIGPEVETYSGGSFEPPEYGHDVVEVLAENRRDALVLGLKMFRKKGAKYLDDSYASPFAGVKVCLAECLHGTSTFMREPDCPFCLAEWAETEAQDILLGVD